MSNIISATAQIKSYLLVEKVWRVLTKFSGQERCDINEEATHSSAQTHLMTCSSLPFITLEVANAYMHISFYKIHTYYRTISTAERPNQVQTIAGKKSNTDIVCIVLETNSIHIQFTCILEIHLPQKEEILLQQKNLT